MNEISLLHHFSKLTPCLHMTHLEIALSSQNVFFLPLLLNQVAFIVYLPLFTDIAGNIFFHTLNKVKMATENEIHGTA